MLEVSRVGVTESDDEIELSLELSIGGSYKKLEKSLEEEEEENSGKEISEKKKAILLPRSGLSFPQTTTTIVGEKVESTGSGSGSEVVVVEEEDYYSERNKRVIQALRRQEARKKREEKLRKSASNSNSVNVVGVANADDKMLLETQQLRSRARDREMRENDALVEDKEHNFAKCVGNDKSGTIIKDSNFIFTSRNNGGVSDGSQEDHRGSGTKSAAAVSFLQNNVPYYPQFLQCATQKSGFAHPHHNHMVGKDENGSTIGKNVISQPVNFRTYPNGNGKRDYGTGGDSESEQNSGKCGSEIPKVMRSSNGSPERTSSAVSDYRSTSGKGGSSSESGSHSSSIGANEQQFGVSPTIQIIASEKKDLGLQQQQEGGGGGGGAGGRRRRSSETNEADVKASSKRPKPEVPKPSLPRMPCVSTTGNGPNGKTVTGFLYSYTKTEVSIVCVCHGTSFSPAEFVEHAGGAAHVTNPLRHITMVPSPFADSLLPL